MFLTDLGSRELSYGAKGMEQMCGYGTAFPGEFGSPTSAPASGETAPGKRLPTSTFPAGWEAEFAGCRGSKPPSGKKRQPTGLI